MQFVPFFSLTFYRLAATLKKSPQTIFSPLAWESSSSTSLPLTLPLSCLSSLKASMISVPHSSHSVHGPSVSHSTVTTSPMHPRRHHPLYLFLSRLSHHLPLPRPSSFSPAAQIINKTILSVRLHNKIPFKKEVSQDHDLKSFHETQILAFKIKVKFAVKGWCNETFEWSRWKRDPQPVFPLVSFR